MTVKFIFAHSSKAIYIPYKMLFLRDVQGIHMESVSYLSAKLESKLYAVYIFFIGFLFPSNGRTIQIK